MACCMALSACSSAPIDYPGPTPQVTTPAQGASLSGWGLTHEPAERIWLPSGTTLTYTADQPNLLIAVGVLAEAEEVEYYLRQSLPGLGWEITSEAEGAVMFASGAWHGAYVRGEDSWALTVRND